MLVSGCDDLPSQPGLAPGTPSLLAATADQSEVRLEEAEFFEIEREIPGFGGYAFDDNGDMLVHVKGVTKEKEGRVRQKLGAVLNQRRRGLKPGGGRIMVREGRFSFPELAEWRNQLTDALLGKGLGVRSTDADEFANQVVVAVAGDEARHTVRRKLLELDIPQSAVHIVEQDNMSNEGTAGAQAESRPGYVDSDDTYSASRGGLIIRYMDDGVTPFSGHSYYRCTIGFFAYKNGQQVGVSNSHCSEDMYSGGGDGTFYFRNIAYDYPFAGANSLINPFGREIHDRGFHDYCGKWYNPLRWCRHADAMLFSLEGSVQTAPGFIARPARINPGSSDSDVYTEIDRINPSFRITARNSSRRGEIINKVGIRTGWTQGTVTATCKDVDMLWIVVLPQPVMKCQHEASYGRGGGDSGAPVFVTDGYGNADLRGIHWGHYLQGSGYVTVFSSLGGVERDLGSLQVLAPAAPPPLPPYSVAIGGDAMLDSGVYGTWSAVVSSGVAPFSYRWYLDGTLVGAASTYSVQAGGGSFTLDVEVTDDTGETVYGSTWVSVREPCADPTQLECSTP